MKKIIHFPVLLFITLIISSLLYKNGISLINSVLILSCVIISFILISVFLMRTIDLIISGLFVLMICIAYLYFVYHQIPKKYDSSLEIIKKSKSFIGKAVDYPVLKGGKLSVKLKILAVRFENTTDYRKVETFYVRIKTDNLDIKRADVLLINAVIRIPQVKIYDFKYRDYLFNNKIYGVCYPSSEKIVKLQSSYFKSFSDSLMKKSIWKIREGVIIKVKNAFSKSVGEFLFSIFFGMRSMLDEETYASFRRTGMVHLLAISGLHIGFIGSLFFNFCKKFFSFSKAYVISIIILSFYMMIIIGSASSFRAYLMFCLRALFFIVGIHTTGLTFLSLAGIIILFLNPFALFDFGFQFSFIATGGIFYASPFFEGLLKMFKVPEKILGGMSVTFAAFVSVFFIQWSYFGVVPLFSLVSSVIMVPIFTYLFSFLFFIQIFISLSDFSIVNNFIVLPAEWGVKIFLWIISILDKIPAIKMPKLTANYAFGFLIGYFVFTSYFFEIKEFLITKFKRLKYKDYL